MQEFILDHIEWLASVIALGVAWAFRVEYAVRDSMQRDQRQEEEIYELKEAIDEIRKTQGKLAEMANNIEVIKNDITWMKAQIKENAKK